MTEQPAQSEVQGRPCPVCRWPAGAGDGCGTCGWLIRGDLMMGPANPADQVNLNRRLSVERQAYDVRAAVRAAGSGARRDARMLNRLAALARGGPPAPGQLERIVAAVDEVEADLPETSYGVDYALTRLVSGQTRGILFIEIGMAALAAQMLITDDAGVPHTSEPPAEISWPALLPVLRDNGDLWRFWLAGGIGAEDSRDIPDIAEILSSIESNLDRLIAVAAPAVAGQAGSAIPVRPQIRPDVVLITRTRHWAVLDEVASQVRARLLPVAEMFLRPGTGSLAAVIDDVAARAPLRYGYDLILVSVHRDGTVEPSPYRLFPAGAAVRPPHEPLERHLNVAPPPHAADELLLPVVARHGDKQDDWPAVYEHFMSGVSTEITKLTIRLLRPGKVLVRAVPGYRQDNRSSLAWHGLTGQLPRQLAPAERVDVIFLVELGGTPLVVKRRIELIRSIVDLLRASESAAASVRIAVFGYREHESGIYLDNELVVGSEFKSADAISQELDRADLWSAVPIINKWVAPIEDALRHVTRQRGWRASARRVLVTIGSRPPYPPMRSPGDRKMTPCLRDCDWQKDLSTLKNRWKFRCLTVEEPRPGRDVSWAELGSEGRFEIGSSLDRLVQAIGIAADEKVPRIPLATQLRTNRTAPGRGGRR